MDSEFVTYVLYSKTHSKIYIGYTTNLIARFLSHNKLGKGFTAKYRPWEVVYLEVFSTKKAAMKREKELKSFRGREFVRNVFLKNKSGSYPPAGGRWFESPPAGGLIESPVLLGFFHF